MLMVQVQYDPLTRYQRFKSTFATPAFLMLITIVHGKISSTPVDLAEIFFRLEVSTIFKVRKWERFQFMTDYEAQQVMP
jgi:hypothetical protein